MRSPRGRSVELEHHEARRTHRTRTGTDDGAGHGEPVTTVSTDELLVQIGVSAPDDEASAEEVRAIVDPVGIR